MCKSYFANVPRGFLILKFNLISAHAWRGSRNKTLIEGLPLQATILSVIFIIPYLSITEVLESLGNPKSTFFLTVLPSILINLGRNPMIACCAYQIKIIIGLRQKADTVERRKIRRERAFNRNLRIEQMNAFNPTPVKRRLHTMIKLLEHDRIAMDDGLKFGSCKMRMFAILGVRYYLDAGARFLQRTPENAVVQYFNGSLSFQFQIELTNW